MNFSLDCSVIELIIAAAVGYLPGLLAGIVLWTWLKRSRSMPLFYADLVSFIAPLAVWTIMNVSHWTLSKTIHRAADELAILGWIWSLCVIGRLLIPCFTHKLRFRMAAIHIGSLGVLAAVLLALFYC